MTRATADNQVQPGQRSAAGESPAPAIELLAPAGGLPAFFAALEAGADAVYCGLTHFSARAKAKNFTLGEIGSMAAFAHARDKKIYVALNTLLQEKELPLALETLAALEESSIDGLIIQDMGIFRIARRYFPNIVLHGSTQMTVHNGAGARVLADLGFKRVVLARELSLPEISAIHRESPIELEHFVQGALCYSISGRCFFSSFLSGRSGNRGRCEQPCRRRYLHKGVPGYYFSTMDFSAIDLLPQLLAAGVRSLKIEGRMKNAEYVGRVVTAYRLVLDAPDSGRDEALRQARLELDLALGRGSTNAFLTGQPGNAVPPPSRKGTMGKHLGTVTGITSGIMKVSLAGKLHIGDRLKVLPRNDQNGVGLTVLKLTVRGRRVQIAQTGDLAAIRLPEATRVRAGDEVYKVGGRELFALSESACRKRLAGAKRALAPLFLEITVSPERMRIVGDISGVRLEQSYEIETSPARSTPLNETILTRTFSKTGDNPFSLAGLKAVDLPTVVIPPSLLNEIRRNYYLLISERLKEHRASGILQQVQEISRPLPRIAADAQPLVMVRVAGIGDIRAVEDPSVQRLLLPLRPENFEHQELFPLASGQRDRIVWDIPAIIFPGDWDKTSGLVRQAMAMGFTRFRLNNIGHFLLFARCPGAELTGGSPLYAMNTEAALAWLENGASDITFSLEDDHGNIGAFLKRAPGFPAWMTVYGPVVLMTSRIPLAAADGDIFQTSRKSESFRLHNDHGLTVLENRLDFSLLDKLPILKGMGISRFCVDLTNCGFFSEKGQAIMQGLSTGEPLPYPTTSWNFDRGLQGARPA